MLKLIVLPQNRNSELIGKNALVLYKKIYSKQIMMCKILQYAFKICYIPQVFLGSK